MATIEKRKDSYRITVSLGQDVDGKKVRTTTTYKPEAKTPKAIEKEVRRFADDFERRVRDGKYLSGETISFREFQSVWLSDWAEQHLTTSVLEHYQMDLKNHVLPDIGHMKLSAIRPPHVQGIITKMIKSGLKAKTIRHVITALNSVMRYAYRMQIIAENPCTRCELPRLDKNNDIHFFTVEQTKTFFKALDMKYPYTYKAHTRTLKSTGESYEVPEYTEYWAVPLQYKVLFYLAIVGGFRRGEMCALTWEDIHPETLSVSINKAAAKTNSGQIIKDPKTVAGNREITCTHECFELLDQWKREQRALSMKLGSAWEGYRGRDYDKNAVFIQLDNGKPIKMDSVSQKFKQVIKAYNATCENEDDKLPTIRLHDLRHTSASYLIAQGINVATVAHRLGHSDPSITLNIYTHAQPDKDREAAATLEALLNEA